MVLPKYQSDSDSTYAINERQYYSLDNEQNNIHEDQQLVPDYQPQSLHNWEFAMFNSAFSSNIEVFVSSDSLNKYKAFQKNSNKDMHLNINELQRDGIGLPLLKANGSNNVFNSNYLTIYKFKSPETGKVFNPKVDRFVFCKVTHSWHTRCHQYTLKFDPYPGNPDKIFKIELFRHHSLPIVDFMYQGRKYRWIYESTLVEIDYSYVLYELNNNQTSMTDDLDIKKKIPSKNNPLMKFSMKDFLTPNSIISKKQFRSEIKIGELRRLSDIFLGSLRQTAEFITPQRLTNEITNCESIHSIDNDTLVYLSLSLVLKRFKDEEKKARDASVNS